jgi:hypothetical protein
MPKRQWTTKEQYEWLTGRMPSFTAAQENKSIPIKHFFGPLYVDWFKEFPCPEPTADQLADAKGDKEVAVAKAESSMKSVSSAQIVIFIRLLNTFY